METFFPLELSPRSALSGIPIKFILTEPTDLLKITILLLSTPRAAAIYNLKDASTAVAMFAMLAL